MTERVITLRPEPIIIDTAHGPIEIHRVEESRRSDSRRLRIMLPAGTKICIGQQQARERSSWVEIDEGGEMKPKHRHIQSIVDDDGNLVELRPAKVLRAVSVAH